MGAIGEPLREIQVEPISIPIPNREEPQPAPPVEIPTLEPERVPA